MMAGDGEVPLAILSHSLGAGQLPTVLLVGERKEGDIGEDAWGEIFCDATGDTAAGDLLLSNEMLVM